MFHRLIRKYQPYTFYDKETGWYVTFLILPYYWSKGIDTQHQEDYVLISFGPFHLGVAREKYYP